MSVMRSTVFKALACAAALALLSGAGARAQIDGPVAVTGGQVQGRIEDGLSVFRGMPFAAPPVGDLRWRPPAPVAPWSGVRAADAFAPACMQGSGGDASEDCLYLNVWSPAASADERLPVMVWIYGGGFGGGATSTPLQAGDVLAKQGVVVVSIAYRVGPLGFMAHPELSAESPDGVSGNYGILDLVAGLAWTKANIAAFGGDPDKVTIFGQSAGAIAVSMLAASPRAEGLFEGAISQSGGSFGTVTDNGGFGENVQPLAAAEADGAAFTAKMGASSIAGLRALGAEAIQEGSRGAQGLGWPIEDGVVIPDNQYKLYEAGRYNDTPVLIGFDSDDGESFVRSWDPAEYPALARERLGAMTDRVLAAYPADRPEGARRSARDLARDMAFGWQTWAWAELQTRGGGSDAYVYYFDQRPPYPADSRYATVEGAPHGAEMGFVFGHLDQIDLPWTPEDHAMSEEMVAYWTNFAKTGNPNGDGLPVWPVYDPDAPEAMIFKGAPHVDELPNRAQLETLDAYFAYRRDGAER